MAFHTVVGGASGAAAFAGWGLFATAASSAAPHDPTTVLLLVPAIISSFAAVIGAGTALVSFVRHRNDQDELTKLDDRIDRIERILMHDNE